MDKKKNELKQLLKKFKEEAGKNIDIDKLIFFGSRAKGTSRKGSDVDLIFVSKDFKRTKSFQRSQQLYKMWNYEYDIDIICLTPEEFSKKRKQIYRYPKKRHKY